MVITVKRTKQVAQFEPITIEWSQEIDGLDPVEVTQLMLKEMDKQIDRYLKGKTSGGSGDWDAFNRVLEKTSENNPISVGDLESLDRNQREILNNLKKAYKRSPAWKSRSTNSDVENERNRKG
ncbi:MAG: hypothetical protein M0R80_27705 [Proteobacteria bacterium]|jgi:hypothetical protein|nr:hypothetical protein [Pseudomonadota bacterium]